MFRIEFLSVTNHPQLGNLEVTLSENEEVKNVSKPYTSVIIGPNGTGKSYILRTVAEILRQFKNYSDTDEKKFNLPYDLHLRYKFYHNTYEIVTRKIDSRYNSGRKQYLFFKNRPLDSAFINSNSGEIQLTNFEVLYRELEFPNRLLVNSVIPTDRFTWQDSNSNDFYQYLGARSTNSTSSTKSTARRTVRHVFNATSIDGNFKKTILELLQFLGFENTFKVHYTTKVNKLFFSGKLTTNDFKKYFEEWWDPEFTYTSRKQENPLWSIPYYNNNLKNDNKSLAELVKFLNNISNQDGFLLHKKNSSSKILSVDLIEQSTTEIELKFISQLENLDIINLDGIKINKSNSILSIDQVSSGEYHLLISFIGIFSNISQDSVILIDEPEISLHPNWQMRYITFLKNVFAKFASCHFILTTHSHFLISDLEGKSSSITSIKRDETMNALKTTILKGLDTYGWSAEDILYNVFNVFSTWNSFLEADLTKLLGLIANNSDDYATILSILRKLQKLPERPNDPLQEIILEANSYLTSLE